MISSDSSYVNHIIHFLNNCNFKSPIFFHYLSYILAHNDIFQVVEKNMKINKISVALLMLSSSYSFAEEVTFLEPEFYGSIRAQVALQENTDYTTDIYQAEAGLIGFVPVYDFRVRYQLEAEYSESMVENASDNDLIVREANIIMMNKKWGGMFIGSGTTGTWADVYSKADIFESNNSEHNKVHFEKLAKELGIEKEKLDALHKEKQGILLESGQAREILEKEENKYWKWKVYNFENNSLFFTSKGIGEWSVLDAKENQVVVSYKYTFYSKNIFLHPLNWLFVKIQWRGMMKKALIGIQKQAESKETFYYEI